MGLILTLSALILLFIIGIPSIIIGIVLSLFTHRANRYFIDIAKSIDKFGNVLCQYLFNVLLINKNGYKFGNTSETISSVLGKNYKEKTLTITGLFISKVLNKLDPNHVIKSIDNSIN